MAEPRSGSPSIVGTAASDTDKTVTISLPDGDEKSKSPFSSPSLLPLSGAKNSVKSKNVMASNTSCEESGSGGEKQAATAELTEATATSTSATSSGTAVKEKDDRLKGSSRSSDADGSETTKGDDVDFDPSSELNEFDDEATLDEEEELSHGSSNANELDDLAHQGEMPLEDLLAMYGYGNPNKCSSPGQPMSSSQSPVGKSPNYYGNCNSNSSSESEEILCNQDLTLDKDEIARDLRLSSRAPVAVDDLPEEITSLLEPPVSSVDDEADGLDAAPPTRSSQDSSSYPPSRELRQRPHRHASKGVFGKHHNNNKRRHSEIMTATMTTNNSLNAPSATKVQKESTGLNAAQPDSTSSKADASPASESNTTIASAATSFSSAMDSESQAEETLPKVCSSVDPLTHSESESAKTKFTGDMSKRKEVETGVVEMIKFDGANASVTAKEDYSCATMHKMDADVDATSDSQADPGNSETSAVDRASVEVSSADRLGSDALTEDRVGSDASTPSGSEANPFGDSPTPAEKRRGFEKLKGNPDKLDGLQSSSTPKVNPPEPSLQLRTADSDSASSCSGAMKTFCKTDPDMEIDFSGPSRAAPKAKAVSKSGGAPAPYPIAITPAANYAASSSARSVVTPSPDTPSGSRRRSEDKEDRLGIERLLRSADTDSESEDEEDYEPADYWRKTISVGSMFQATVPKLERYETSGLPYPLEKDTCLWHPRKISQEQTVLYLQDVLQTSTEIQLAASALAAGSQTSGGPSTSGRDVMGSGSFSPPLLNFGNGTHVKDEELALYILKRSSYDWKEALKAYAQCLKGKTKARDLDSSHETPNSLTKTQISWSEEECRAFEEGLRIYGKNFFLIKKNRLPSRTVMDLVQFYYLWKKTERHDVFANKNRLEKKKYALHPGITDYMDKFIEDHEDQLYHQLQQQQNPLIQHMQQPQMSHHHLNHTSMMGVSNSPYSSSQVPDLVAGEGLKSPTLNSLLYGASTANEIVNSFGMNPTFVNQGAIDSASINSVLLDSSPQSQELSSSTSPAPVPPASDISISAEAVEALRAISHSLNNDTIEDFVQMASRVVSAAAGGTVIPQTRDLSTLITGFPSSSSPSSITQPQQSHTPQAFPPSHPHNQSRGPSSPYQPNHPKPHSHRQLPQAPSPSNRGYQPLDHSSALQQQQQLSPSGLRKSSSTTTMHSSLSEAKTMSSPSTSLLVNSTGRVNPPAPSSHALENQTRPDSSTRLHRASDDVDSEEPSTSTSFGKKRLEQSSDSNISTDGPLHQTSLQGTSGESKISSSSLSQHTFMSSSSSASSCSSSTLVASEASGKEIGNSLRNHASPASQSNATNFDNSDGHSLPTIQQQHFSQPSSVSSSSINKESSTSINMRGINT